MYKIYKIWFGFMAYQPLYIILCQIIFLHVYYIYMIRKNILLITFLNKPKLILLSTVKWVLYMDQIGQLVGFGMSLWHINHCRLFNAKSSLYINILNTYIFLIIFLNEPKVIFLLTFKRFQVLLSNTNISINY